MFRNGEAQAGRELDGAITETKASRAQALKELGHESRRRQMVIDFSGVSRRWNLSCAVD